MIDFYKIDLNEAIDGLSYEEKLEYLKEREDEVNDAMEELENLLSDIEEIKDEIEEEHQKEELHDKVLLDLHSAGYDVLLNDDGSLSFGFEESAITIMNPYSDSAIKFYFNTVDELILPYRKMISSLLPDYKQNGKCFSKTVSKETLNEEIISLVKRLKK